jgi:hypothetical protein
VSPVEHPHGTRRRYQLGCRCVECTRANTGYHRAYRIHLTGTSARPATTLPSFSGWQPRRWAELAELPARAREW